MRKLLMMLSLGVVVLAGCTTTTQKTDVNAPVEQNESAALETVNEVMPAPVSPAIQEEGWQAYVNNEFGFQMTFPNMAWSGYRVFQKNDQVMPGVSHLYFSVATKADGNNVSGLAGSEGYVAPFAISVYPLQDWKIIEEEQGPKPTKIAENSQYVFAYGQWQDAPDDLAQVDFGIQQLVESFRLNN